MLFQDQFSNPWIIENSFGRNNQSLGSINVVERFFSETGSNMYYLDFEKFRLQTKDRCNFFMAMSKILHGNEVYHEMVRLYFYFLYRSISQLHNNHPFFKEVMPEFSNTIIERTYGAPEDHKYGASVITDHLRLPSEQRSLYNEVNQVKPEYYSKLLRLLSESYLKHKFVGDWHDIRVLSAMHNIRICVIEATTNDNAPLNSNQSRLWHLSN